MNYLADATVMSVLGQTCNSTTDIIASNAYLGAGILGRYVCFDYVDQGANICARSRVQLNEAVIGQYPYRIDGIAKTACHEIGHSVGLQHYNTAGILAPNGESDCMRSGQVPSTKATWRSYGTHHKSHIDNYY